MQRVWKCLSRGLLLLSIVLVLAAAPARAQDSEGPDYSGVSDILYGQNYLLHNDDIVIVHGAKDLDSNPVLYLQNVEFNNTENATVSGRYYDPIGSGAIPYVDGHPGFVRVAAGHLFNLLNDTVVFLTLDTQQATFGLTLNFWDALGDADFVVQIPNTPDWQSNPNSMLMADFTGDGYDDLVINYGTAGRTLVVTAVDVNNWSAGVKFGPVYTHTFPMTSLAAGDLDGDGQNELVAAAAYGPAELLVLRVDPMTLALTPELARSLGATGIYAPKVVTGNFDQDLTDDEVIVAYYIVGGQLPNGYAGLYDYGSRGQPLAPVYTRTFSQAQIVAMDLAAGKINPAGESDQFVVAVGDSTTGSSTAYIFSVESSQFVQEYDFTLGNFSVVRIILGNFNATYSDGSADPSLQLAMMSVDGVVSENQSQYRHGIWRFPAVAEDDFTAQQADMQTTATQGEVLSTDMIDADLQGRSLRLGKPEKLTINNHSEVRTVVGMPPMHIDWALPSCNDPAYQDNCAAPNVVKILAEPFDNFAQFNTEIQDSNQSSTQNTTSWTLAIKETVNSKVTYGIPDIASVSLQVKDAAQQTHDTSVATASNSYSSQQFDASVKTGFADHVWFQSHRFNVWSYPVLGFNVCPQDKPNCSAAEQQPLHVQFSAPDSTMNADMDGSALEWYQPAWEPGNILSYPGTQTQLLALLPRTATVNVSDIWQADTSGSNVSVSWSTQTVSSTTQGSTQAHSNDVSISVSGKAEFGGLGVSGSVGVDVASSKSLETLNSATSVHGASTGFVVAKGPQGVEDYDYQAQTYILGQAPLSGTLQSLALTATVQTSGTLRLAYWANPFTEGSSTENWWTDTYTVADLALNHPQRWTWTKVNNDDLNQMTFNNALTTTSPYDQEFFYMRGLFITPADSPTGPQLTSIPVTQTVLLQARVYNYSHIDTNLGGAAGINVVFYGQLFDNLDQPSGDSFVIGSANVLPIPGFASNTTVGNAPNWRLASVGFDPSAHFQTQNGNVDLRFWVVAYMQDANGGLAPEMPGHGLTAVPNISEIGSPNQVPIEYYSNNVGVYRQILYVEALTTTQTLAGAVLTPSVSVDNVTSQPLIGTAVAKHQVSTVVRNSGTAPIKSLQLFYYDGDPAHAGRAFEWESIPYLAPGAAYTNRITFTPQTCGDQTVYVVAVAEGKRDTVTLNIQGGDKCLQYLPIIGKQ